MIVLFSLPPSRLLAQSGGGPAISNITDNCSSYEGNQVPAYAKLEITFSVATSASNLQLPYDPAPPPGVTAGLGISVDALFTPDNWQTAYSQPAFYYQDFDYQVKLGQDWIYPNGDYAWKVRFSPDRPGRWQYRLVARDASGESESAAESFTVAPSTSHGFVRVSQNDPRYFAYQDGSYFPALGYNMNFDELSWNNPVTDNRQTLQIMGQNGIQLVRLWLSQWSIFGSQDNPWRSPVRGSDYDSLYTAQSGSVYPGSDTSMGLQWSTDLSVWPGNPCMFLGWMKDSPAVKPDTSYHISIRYRIPQDLAGPAIAGQPYGLVAKFGGWLTGAFTPATPWRTDQECAYPAALTDQTSPNLNVRPITSYASAATTGWASLEGDFVTDAQTTGGGPFLPFLYLALENVNPGPGQGNTAWIDEVQIRENLGGGQYGPDIISKPSMSQLEYYDQRYSYAFDKLLDLAAQDGVYLKLVLLEKNEFIQDHFDYNGNPVGTGSNNYFYGNWSQMTKIRWLQEAYWRYVQARWGYSPNIHSWELLNEGDPYNGLHYQMAEDFANYMHQFKPDDHLVTTSFWNSFPTLSFWQNSAYPDVDYADVHAYVFQGQGLSVRVDKPFPGVSISVASADDYYDTAAETQQLSMLLGAQQPYGVGKPVMRGETGFVAGDTDTAYTGLYSDTTGIWLHNFIWGQINPGGLIESYWYDNPHIVNPHPPKPVAPFDHRPEFRPYYDFIKDVPLTNGNYQDAAATTSQPALRAWGQKDLVHQAAHLWIANRDHTWQNVVNEVPIQPITGTVTIGGFLPNRPYLVSWWDTYNGTITSIETLYADANGNILLAVSNLTSDEAVKIVPGAGLMLIEVASPATYNGVGDVITHTYVLKNASYMTLSGPFSIWDDRTKVTCPDPPASLAPDDIVACSGNYVITRADRAAGSVADASQGAAINGGQPVYSNRAVAMVIGPPAEGVFLPLVLRSLE